MGNTDTLPLALTVQQVADILSVSQNTAYGLIHSNRIEAVSVGRQYRVSRKALLDFLGMSAA